MRRRDERLGRWLSLAWCRLRQQRQAGLAVRRAVLVLSVFLVGLGAAMPYLEHLGEQQIRIDQLLQRVHHERSDSEALPALRAQLRRQRAVIRRAPHIMGSETRDQAVATLLARLRSAVKPASADGAGSCQLDVAERRSEHAVASAESPFRRVPVHAEFRCGLDGLFGLLYRLEGTPPYLQIDQLLVERTNPVRRAGVEVPPDLRVTMRVTGIMLPARGGGE